MEKFSDFQSNFLDKPIAVFVDDEADIAAFENFSASDVEGAAAPAPAATEEPKKEESKPEAAAPAASSNESAAATPSHDGMYMSLFVIMC